MLVRHRVGSGIERAFAFSACGLGGNAAVRGTRQFRSRATLVSQFLPQTTPSLLDHGWQSPWQQSSAWPGIVLRPVRRGRRLPSARRHYRSRAPGLLRIARAKSCCTFSYDFVCPTLKWARLAQLRSTIRAKDQTEMPRHV